MKPDRWARIKDIFSQAAEKRADERPVFIRFRCDGDESLAREIESLLAAHDQAHSFIESSALEQEEAVTFPLAEDANRRIGPYRLVRELGSGGMGSVYLAERADGQYRKKVAIKLIKLGMDSEFIIRRFRNERQILADLSHPNIAGLLDGGSTEDGLPYFVLEHVDGVRIDDYCDSNTLPLPERLSLFRTVCSAIDYAHKRSIVHRDIKPSNILVTPERIPKLLDFGIAKLLETEPAGQTIDSTATGLRLMTPEYASPEQIRGEPITPASDVYALGVLLYGLLTGHRPYQLKSRNLQEIARAICEQEPEKPSITISRTEEVPSGDGEVTITVTPESVSRTRNTEPKALRKLLGGDLDAIVLMAMGKRPELRYPTVDELSADIGRHLDGLPVIARRHMRRRLYTSIRSQWKAACAVLLALVVVGVLVRALRPTGPPPPSPIRSVAVLPFKPMSQEASDEYLAQGVADSLITRLSNVREVMVRPTSAVLKYAGRERDPVAAGRELGVDALLDGSIQKIGDRIRVTVQLLRTSDGTPIWAYKCDDRCTNIFEIQDSISEKTAGALLLKLTDEERKLINKRPTQNQEAYEAYVKGRYFWNKRTPDDLKKAGDYFQQALDIDPTCALAYSGLADTFSYRGYAFDRLPPGEAIPIARAAAERAVQIDDSLAEAHSSLALARFLDWDFAGAESEFKRSIELNPNYPSVHHFYAVYLSEVLGRFDDALAEANKGLALDPMSLPINNMVAVLTFQARRWDEAIQQYRKLAEIFPSANVHGNLSDCYKQKGMEKEAAEEFLQWFKVSGATESKLQAYRHAYTISGWEGIKRKSVEDDVADWRRDPWHLKAFYIAIQYADFGDKEQALLWLRRAYDAHSGMLIWISTQPHLDSLRPDPRFKDLLRQVGFPLPAK